MEVLVNDGPEVAPVICEGIMGAGKKVDEHQHYALILGDSSQLMATSFTANLANVN